LKNQARCYDVAVVGAGPAGCSAARALAEKGVKVALLEKASLPRYKTCGGGVLGRAYKLLPEGAREAVEREFRSVFLNFWGTGLEFVATRSRPLVYMTMRAELDGLLASEAKSAGVDVFESCAVRTVKASDGWLQISGDSRNFLAKFLIAADGVQSAIAKAGGWSELPHLAPALEWEVFLSHEDFAQFGNVARFDFDLIDAGYAWVFPKRDHLSVGILTMRRRSRDLRAKLECYLRSVGIGQVQKIERHGYLIPVVPRREKLARGRLLLAGDAAGLVDPVTGEGISYAILSGQLAATALLEADLDVSQVSGRYDSLMRDKILGELKAARFLANFLYNYPRFRDWVFRRGGRKLTEFVADVALGDRSYSGALREPASYLKMLGIT
jgi:geranylgeranyl reductase family protein